MTASDALELCSHGIIRQSGMQHRRRDAFLFEDIDFFFHTLFI